MMHFLLIFLSSLYGMINFEFTAPFKIFLLKKLYSLKHFDLMSHLGLCATFPKLGKFLHQELVQKDQRLLEPSHRKCSGGRDGHSGES